MYKELEIEIEELELLFSFINLPDLDGRSKPLF